MQALPKLLMLFFEMPFPFCNSVFQNDFQVAQALLEDTATVVSFLDANTCMPAKVGFIQAYILFSSFTSSFYYNF